MPQLASKITNLDDARVRRIARATEAGVDVHWSEIRTYLGDIDRVTTEMPRRFKSITADSPAHLALVKIADYCVKIRHLQEVQRQSGGAGQTDIAIANIAAYIVRAVNIVPWPREVPKSWLDHIRLSAQEISRLAILRCEAHK